MCFQPKDNSAAIMRGQEAERQQNVLRGTDKVNAAFSGFGDEFYGQREKDYRDFYMPQLEKQGQEANDQLTYSLARGGNLDSSTGAKQAANLTGKINDARASVSEGAFGAGQQARADVEGNRSDLLNMVRGGGNLANAAATASARAQELTRPPPYSPLADLFANFTGQLSNSVALQGQGYPGWSVTRQRAANPSKSVTGVT
jgi:hypothetical protein